MQTHYETKRLVLQVLTPDYCHKVLDFYLSNKDIFQPHDPLYPKHYYTADYQYQSLSCDYHAFLERKGVRFYLFDKHHPQNIIGTVSFSNVSYGYANQAVVGYKLAKQHHHMGYAFEALQKAIELMFYEEKIHRITAYIMPDNEASIRLIERLYFTYEGVAKEYALIQGKWEDHLQYALINHL